MIYFVFIIPGQTQTEPRKSSSTPKPPVPADEPSPSQQQAPSANASGPAVCDGGNLSCMIAASRDCTQAKANFIHSANASGIETTNLTFMEIRGMNGSDCVFYIKNEDARIRFTNEKIGTMVVNGSTIEEIAKLEMEADKNAKFGTGLDGTCHFQPSELTALLIQWDRSGVSGISNGASVCNGTLFNSSGSA